MVHGKDGDKMYTVEMKRLVERFSLENLTPSLSLEGRVVRDSNINRPALQLAGFMIILIKRVCRLSVM